MILRDELKSLPTNEEFLEWLGNTDIWKLYDCGKIDDIRIKLVDGQCDVVCRWFSGMFDNVEFWLLDDGGNDYHVFMKSDGKYYDAYNYDGVDNPNELKFVQMYMRGKYDNDMIMKHMHYVSTGKFDDDKYYKMVKTNGKSYVKTFEEFIKESFRDEDLLTDEEMDYLHGKCHRWVLENYKPGNKIYLITCYDLEIQERALVHCGLYIDGKYVDVRGDVDDMDEVLDGFDYGPELDVEIIDIDEFKTYCKKNHLE